VGRVFRFPNAVYWIDAEAQRVDLLFSTTNPRAIRGMAESYVGSMIGSLTVLMTDNQLRLFSAQGKLLCTTPVEHTDPSYNLSVTPLPTGKKFFIWYESWGRDRSGAAPLPTRITEIDADGTALKRHVLPPLSQPQYVSGSPYPFAALVPPGALAAFGAYAVIGDRLGHEIAEGMLQSIKEDVSTSATFTFVAAVAALICAGLAGLIGRRCALSPRARWWWTCGVFWLGAFGLLMLLALRDWPARETCHSCGKKRVVNRAHCEHCGAEFAMPALDGTEIFAS